MDLEGGRWGCVCGMPLSPCCLCLERPSVTWEVFTRDKGQGTRDMAGFQMLRGAPSFCKAGGGQL